MIIAAWACVSLAFELLRTHARQRMMSTWIGDAQLVGCLPMHPDLVPDVDSRSYFHHGVGVPLLAAVKGQAVQLLIWLDNSVVCLASPASMTSLSTALHCVACRP